MTHCGRRNTGIILSSNLVTPTATEVVTLVEAKEWLRVNVEAGVTVETSIPVWEWAAHANIPPVSTAIGQNWITKGVYEVGDLFIPDGSTIVAKKIGASVISSESAVSEYWINS